MRNEGENGKGKKINKVNLEWKREWRENRRKKWEKERIEEIDIEKKRDKNMVEKGGIKGSEE